MTITISKYVNVSPAHLFLWLTDPERQRRWIDGLVEVERPADFRADNPVGQTYRLQLRRSDRMVPCDVTVIEYHPPDYLTLKLARPGYTLKAGYALTRASGGTRLLYQGEPRLEGAAARLIDTLLGGRAARDIDQELERLKEESEAEAAEMRNRRKAGIDYS